MSARYEVDGWLKLAEEDTYEGGCIGGTTMATGPDAFKADTLDALIDQLRAFVPFTIAVNDIELDACDDDGRIDLSGLETNDGSEPTAAQLAAWKAGNYRLWAVTYTFQAEQVTRTTVALKGGR